MTTNWRRDAACGGAPLDWFFPGPNGDTTEAQRLCAGCPVRDMCLTEALALREIYGFRGGTTGDERVRLLRRKANHAEVRPMPEEDVRSLLASGWTPPAIAAYLDVHVDRVRRLRRKLLGEQGLVA